MESEAAQGWDAEDVPWRALPGLPNLVVNPAPVPALEHFWLILGQVCLHGEGSLGQVDRLLQFERHLVASPK